MALERTLSIIKPDAVAKNVIGEIYARFEKAGLKVVAAKMKHLRGTAFGFYHLAIGLMQLLAAIGIAREEVRPLGPPAPDGRDLLLSRALRPAATTDAWATPDPALDAAAALRNVALVVAEEPQEEALAAAVALREVLEEAGRTATLITPDRTLARRVAADLTRWGVEVDDSAGLPLADTPAGVFSRLVAEVAANGLAPVAL